MPRIDCAAYLATALLSATLPQTPSAEICYDNQELSSFSFPQGLRDSLAADFKPAIESDIFKELPADPNVELAGLLITNRLKLITNFKPSAYA